MNKLSLFPWIATKDDTPWPDDPPTPSDPDPGL
jgi:hypothetical protein